MKKYLLGVALGIALLPNGSTQAQSCGYRAHVVVLHTYFSGSAEPGHLYTEFDDAGVPLLDFTAAANRVTTLAKEGAWWAAPTTPPKTLFYPPHMIQFIELRYYCQ